MLKNFFKKGVLTADFCPFSKAMPSFGLIGLISAFSLTTATLQAEAVNAHDLPKSPQITENQMVDQVKCGPTAKYQMSPKNLTLDYKLYKTLTFEELDKTPVKFEIKNCRASAPSSKYNPKLVGARFTSLNLMDAVTRFKWDIRWCGTKPNTSDQIIGSFYTGNAGLIWQEVIPENITTSNYTLIKCGENFLQREMVDLIEHDTTEQYLFFYDRQKNEMWKINATGISHAKTISSDGTRCFVGLTDGGILIIDENGKRWRYYHDQTSKQNSKYDSLNLNRVIARNGQHYFAQFDIRYTLSSGDQRGKSVLAVSSHDGQNWQMLQSFGLTGPNETLENEFVTINDLQFVNTNTAYLVANSTIYKTTDTGQSWSVFCSPTLYTSPFKYINVDNNTLFLANQVGKPVYCNLDLKKAGLNMCAFIEPSELESMNSVTLNYLMTHLNHWPLVEKYLLLNLRLN